MTTSPKDQALKVREAIGAYLALLDRNPSDGEVGLRRLATTLDHLVTIYFGTCDVDPVEKAEAPSKRYSEYYQRAAKAFPELGLYPYADPGGEPGEEGPAVSDAIDDIADIAGDLDEVLWYFDHASDAEAIWHFRFGYQHHWGDHLHSLRNYLHSTRVAAW